MTLEVSRDSGLATLRLSRAHGNAINGELVAELIEACDELGRDDDVRGVLLAAPPLRLPQQTPRPAVVGAVADREGHQACCRTDRAGHQAGMA